MKHIILCADDYSQTLAISQGILELLQKKRLSATACMTNSPHWITHAAWLNPFINKADIGLHFNLSEGKPLTKALGLTHQGQFISLPKLLLKSQLRRLNQQSIIAELNAQLDQFIFAMGKLPDFLDGHQHIHHLPTIRDAVLSVYKQRFKSKNTYIRAIYQDKTIVSLLRSPYSFKKIII